VGTVDTLSEIWKQCGPTTGVAIADYVSKIDVVAFGRGVLTSFWENLPIGRVTRLCGASPEAIIASLDPLRDGMPAIVMYCPDLTASVSEAVGSVLGKLEQVAVELWPAWLPSAERLNGPGGAGILAARSLAMEMAAATHHFGPFLADLAEEAVSGAKRRLARFPAEVRAAELSALIAAAFNRTQTALLVQPPVDLAPQEAHTLVDACDWLAHHGGLAIWLTGELSDGFERFNAVQLALGGDLQSVGSKNVPVGDGGPQRKSIQYPPLAGRPHPGSKAEKALEAALSACDWAAGRAWNQTFQLHTLVNPIRVDLLWTDERFVVEVDGPDHCSLVKFEADRRRDVHLQLEGFAVLRFTNDRILEDISTVRSQIERFIQSRRTARLNGERRAG
jgi:very-short-patch-repair endonuclease